MFVIALIQKPHLLVVLLKCMTLHTVSWVAKFVLFYKDPKSDIKKLWKKGVNLAIPYTNSKIHNASDDQRCPQGCFCRERNRCDHFI